VIYNGWRNSNVSSRQCAGGGGPTCPGRVGSRGAGSRTPPTTTSRRRVSANETSGSTTVTTRPAPARKIPISFSGEPACWGDKKIPRRVCPAGGRQLKLVTRASRNDVAVDADAKGVVVLILDAVDGRRLGRAAQRGIGHGGIPRCRLQLRIDH